MFCKHQYVTSICTHIQKLKSYIYKFENLGVQFPKELAIDMVLNSLSSLYHQYFINYNMNNLKKTFMELHDVKNNWSKYA